MKTFLRIISFAFCMTAVGGAFVFADVGAADAALRRVVDAAASPDTVTVGDVITFTAAIPVPPGHVVIAPETARGFGNFTVIEADARTVDAEEGIVIASYTYKLATFRPQSCTIPPLRFLILREDGGEEFIDASGALVDTIYTAPVPVTVLSVIPHDAPHDELSIRDLKAQQKTGGPDLRFLWILAAVAAGVAAYYLIKKYAKIRRENISETAALKPPYEEAVEAIGVLVDKKYLDRGLVREYAFELSEIFKRYIGRHYGTNAVELTSEEILSWFKGVDLTVDLRMRVEQFFKTSDMIKFAKWVPDRKTSDSLLVDVVTFLEATKPIVIVQENVVPEKVVDANGRHDKSSDGTTNIAADKSSSETSSSTTNIVADKLSSETSDGTTNIVADKSSRETSDSTANIVADKSSSETSDSTANITADNNVVSGSTTNTVADNSSSESADDTSTSTSASTETATETATATATTAGAQ